MTTTTLIRRHATYGPWKPQYLALCRTTPAQRPQGA